MWQLLSLEPEFASTALEAHGRILAALRAGEDFEIASVDHPLPYEFSPELVRMISVWAD